MAPWEETLIALARRIDRAGVRVHLVGGAVRDLALGRTPRDLDLVVECAPRDEEGCLKALAARASMTPVVFDRRPPATYRIVVDDLVVDTAFCLPGEIRAALARRDFTINAMALPASAAAVDAASPIPPASIVDPFAGLADLAARTIRAVSDTTLEDDPLRMLRAVRLAATLPGFAIDGVLGERIRARAPTITQVAAERVQAELDLVLRSPRAGEAVRRMDAYGLLTPLLPEISPLRGLKQPARHHDHDAFEHTLRAVEESDRLARGHELGLPALGPDDESALKWAALLHDVGKAATATVDVDGDAHFYGHESVSASLAEDALRRLRAPARTIEPVVRLVDLHLRLGALASAGAADRPIRRLVRAAGELLPLLTLLSLADRRAAGGPDAASREEALVATCRRALDLRDEVEAISRAPALLDGREIMEITGLAPGPRVGSIARWIERLRTDGRITTREEAVEILRKLPAPRTPD
ncbi:MAG: HD domain-containing protein [Acidobacteria bacterium]|nr:HD domain-containing protein [Acidobacteriota bacterium]